MSNLLAQFSQQCGEQIVSVEQDGDNVVIYSANGIKLVVKESAATSMDEVKRLAAEYYTHRRQ